MNKFWLLDFLRRQCIIYGPYTRDEAIALAKAQTPTFSPARGCEPTAVREITGPTLIWRSTD